MKNIIFLLFSLVFLLPVSAISASHNIHIGWDHDYQPIDGRTLVGYNLYKEGVKVCTTTTPSDRTMDCTIDSEPGTFNFTLTAFCTEHESEHSAPFPFVLEPELLANFTTNPTSPVGDTPFTVSFDASTSSGAITSYHWDFGDNTTATGLTSSHTYSSAGTFTTVLTINSANRPAVQKSATITVSAKPIATIITNTLSGDAPHTVTFDASSSTGDITSYTWDFGDTNNGTGSTTQHVYDAGNFNAQLTITSANGTIVQENVTISVDPTPIAAVTTSALTGTAPLNVSFDASSSSGNIASYSWDFGDSSISSGSTSQHSYSAGSYTAQLTVTSVHGTTSQTTVNIIASSPEPPVAVITPGTFSGTAPLAVSFDGSSSTNASSYAWVFGDGSTATGENPSHTFTNAGTFTTTLTVTDSQAQTSSQNVTITVDEAPPENTLPSAVISTSTAAGSAPLDIIFDAFGSSDAEGPLSSYVWNFGDGSQEMTGISITHKYTTGGTYYPSLTVTDSHGDTDTVSTPVIITEGAANEPPVAGMTASATEGPTPFEVTFDGSTSTDPEDSSLTYSWNFGDGESGQGITATHIYTSSGIFTATLTVTDDMDANASTSIDITAGDGAPEFKIELGEIEINHNWVRINFTETFTNPIIIAGPPSRNGSHPCVIRMRNINTTGFDIRIQEWPYLDGSHTNETVAYLAMEKGNFTLDDGSLIEVGQFDSNGTEFKEVPFNTPFNTEPVLITSIATFNEEDTATSRLSDISTTSFKHKTQEQQSSVNGHGLETVHYIAWEPSRNSINGITIIVNKTADKVRNRWYTVDYGEQLLNLPVFLGTMKTQDGIDPSAIRYSNKTTSEIQVIVEEEQSEDKETRHTSETVGYFLFSQE